MRRIAFIVVLLGAAVAGFSATAGADDTQTYRIEMYNAFGIVEGSDVRVSGVNAGTVTDLAINEDKRAEATVELSGDLATLGEGTKCSSEPQSLIAEYFIDCEPKGPPLEEGGLVPASRVEQTVQPDLVANTLREPFRDRLRLLINEFGTALAGNPETLNEAIRLGAPALTQLREATRILASQNRVIRDLNANSDEVIGQLAARREDVVRFIQEAKDTAEISVSRRADLSRNFEILDDFLAELEPTLADLETLAREQTPLLADLRAAAPGLNTLATNLPAFNRASEVSLDTLGEAAVVGDKALRRGRDEIAALADSGRNAPIVSEMLADFVRDIDDPRRAVEIDDRAVRDTGRDDPRPGRKDTKGYTGLEGLLNYAYYQPGALNQFDQIGHLLHFSLYYVDTGPCGHFSSGRDPETGEPGLPTDGGDTTTNMLEVARCAATLGPNVPGVNDFFELPKFDPSVCPNGTEPERAREELCDPAGPASSPAATGARSAPAGGARAPSAAPTGPGLPDDVLEDILDLPEGALNNPQDLPQDIQDQLENLGQGAGQGLNGIKDSLDDVKSGLGGKGGKGGNDNDGGGSDDAGGGGGGGQLPGDGATGDLLDFLFGA